MTPHERQLWYDFLKKLKCTFNRQKVIGKYVVDFYCASAKLVIELDGGQHDSPEAVLKDMERDKYLNDLGITVFRYTNIEIDREFNEVCQGIQDFIDDALNKAQN